MTAASDWLVVQMIPRVTLKYCYLGFGDECVMTGGTSWREMSYVGNWDSKGQSRCTLNPSLIIEPLQSCGWITCDVLGMKSLYLSALVMDGAGITATPVLKSPE